MKKTILVSSLLLGASIISSHAFAEREVTFAHAASKESHAGTGYRAFAEKLDELSDGAFEVTENCCGSLGGERDMIEGLQIGTIDITFTSTGPVGNFNEDVYVFDLPFLFESYEHAYAVLDGPIGQKVLDSMSSVDLVGLSWGDNGFRHLTNSERPVKSPADLDGLSIRTMENEIHIEAFRALGARPTPMAFPEVFTALQQGAVDGQENPLSLIVATRFYEAQEHLSLTGHVYSPAIMLASPTFWSSLSDEEKSWFREAAHAARDATREHIQRLEKDGIKLVEKEGVEVVSEVDTDAFREKMGPAYALFEERYGDEVLKQIQDFDH